MAGQGKLSLSTEGWTLLTPENCTYFWAQSIGQPIAVLKGRVGEGAIANFDGAKYLSELQPLPFRTPMASLWQGVAGANRVYAIGLYPGAEVVFDYA